MSSAKRFPFPALPSGWFMVGTSRELAAGALRTVRYFDRDLVLYRTRAGRFRATEAFCPHLGAHLGQGRVEGEELRCAFHGFRFDLEGRCVSTPYPGGRPPARARLAHFPVAEENGLLLVYHDALGRAPTWSPPRLDLGGHTGFRWHRFELDGHPQETSENSVDFGHFAAVHGFERPHARGETTTEGPLMRCHYGFRHRLGPLGLGIDATFDVEVHGLGYSMVHTRAPSMGIDARMLIMATPVTDGHIHLRVGVAMRRVRVPGATAVLHRLVQAGLVHEVGTDVPIWQAKRYEERPALAEGDGEIARYRRWAAQFYPVAET